MPWTDSNYPQSLKNFMAPVRRKAIDIANALLSDGREEGSAIAIATSQAEAWAESRGMQIRKKNAGTASTGATGTSSGTSGSKGGRKPGTSAAKSGTKPRKTARKK